MTTQYNIVPYGNLTNTDGILSDFSTSNYATLPNKFAPSGDSFEIVIKFKVDSIDTSGNTYPTLLASIDTSTMYSGYNLQVFEGALYFEVVQNDEPVVVVQDNTKVLSANTDYYAKVTFDGSAYTTYISTDGTTWVQQASTTSSIYYPSTNINLTLLGKQYSADANNVLNGSIDLNESYINIDNIRWWQGVTSTSNVQTRIQLRHDTAANWTSVNPVLLVGEVGIETDTRKQKFGDGSTAWNSLPYDANSTALNSKADTDLSNLSSTGKAVIDGRWMNVFQEAIGSTATTIAPNSQIEVPFTSLPAKTCEVMFSLSQSTNYNLAVSSSLLTSTTNRALTGTGCICVIMPVSSDKKVRIRNLGSGTASVNFVRMCGYRVLGTNTNT